MGRFVAYCALSTAATASVVVYAYAARVQFYPAVIFLVTSKTAIMVLGNMALALTLLAGRFLKALFLGTLREPELDALYDNARFAVTETCLALTIFREELSARMAVLFTALLFFKCFHWLVERRVEFVEMMEDPNNLGKLTYARLAALMCLLIGVDVGFVFVAAFVSFQSGAFQPSAWLLFGFEFLVLAISVSASFGRFLLHMGERRLAAGPGAGATWHGKAALKMVIDFVADALKVVALVAFFVSLFVYYGLPLHIVRDLFVACRSLKQVRSPLSLYSRLTTSAFSLFLLTRDSPLYLLTHSLTRASRRWRRSAATAPPCATSTASSRTPRTPS